MKLETQSVYITERHLTLSYSTIYIIGVFYSFAYIYIYKGKNVKHTF